MFFSTNLLVGRNAKFSLVWRAATCPSKKLPRKAVLSLSIPNTCREILKFAQLKLVQKPVSCPNSPYIFSGSSSMASL
ncbi:hypothetical protein KIN20_016639 [Parelaphostrongylus tenuis]|uniref:Rad21/Rec8-like protein N-terminal domain-containing protein n=1 Tax=Parelaphostrongylus tenuis TaxID=148309 RepID=A0AAD5MYV0_PARTN|nr:hypothetical protein KIN20_016639 [Parelaphostrongylus tenuis]